MSRLIAAETAMIASAASSAVRSQKLESAYPPPSCSDFHGRSGSRLCTVATCGMAVQEPGEVTGEVRVPRVAVDDVRVLDRRRHREIDRDGLERGEVRRGTGQRVPRPVRDRRGQPVQRAASAPQQCTVTSARRASSRARYSTWTPAPP